MNETATQSILRHILNDNPLQGLAQAEQVINQQAKVTDRTSKELLVRLWSMAWAIALPRFDADAGRLLIKTQDFTVLYEQKFKLLPNWYTIVKVDSSPQPTSRVKFMLACAQTEMQFFMRIKQAPHNVQLTDELKKNLEVVAGPDFLSSFIKPDLQLKSSFWLYDANYWAACRIFADEHVHKIASYLCEINEKRQSSLTTGEDQNAYKNQILGTVDGLVTLGSAHPLIKLISSGHCTQDIKNRLEDSLWRIAIDFNHLPLAIILSDYGKGISVKCLNAYLSTSLTSSQTPTVNTAKTTRKTTEHVRKIDKFTYKLQKNNTNVPINLDTETTLSANKLAQLLILNLLAINPDDHRHYAEIQPLPDYWQNALIQALTTRLPLVKVNDFANYLKTILPLANKVVQNVTNTQKAMQALRHATDTAEQIQKIKTAAKKGLKINPSPVELLPLSSFYVHLQKEELQILRLAPPMIVTQFIAKLETAVMRKMRGDLRDPLADSAASDKPTLKRRRNSL